MNKIIPRIQKVTVIDKEIKNKGDKIISKEFKEKVDNFKKKSELANRNKINYSTCHKTPQILTEGPIPLINNGNTCYMNSSLQSLLVPFMKLNEVERTLPKECHSFWLIHNFVDAFKNRETFSILNFIEKNCKLQYFGSQLSSLGQEDASEFLLHLIDKLDEELMKNDSDYKSSFLNSYDTRYFCNTCGKSNIPTKQIEKTQFLYFNVRKTFKEMMKCYLEHTIDEYRCENCLSQTGSASTSSIFSELSEFLVVCLKRYTGELRKNIELMDLEELVSIPYTNDNETETATYELISTVNHKGGINSGHYFSFVKYKNVWYNANDENISVINFDDISKNYRNINCINIYKRVYK